MSEGQPLSSAYAALERDMKELLATDQFQRMMPKIHHAHQSCLPRFAESIKAGKKPTPHQNQAQGDFNIAWQICYELQIHKDCACFKGKLDAVISCFEQIGDLLEQLEQLDN